MGLRSSVADVVVVNCAMHDRLDRAAVYAEIHRILKPGGRLVVSDEVVATSRGAYGAPRAALDRATITEPECLATVRAAGFDRVTLLQRTAPYEVHGRIVLSLTLQAARGAGGI
jgi:predicted methyltransferase